jgi:hypothetical protein
VCPPAPPPQVKVWNLTNCKLKNNLIGHTGYVNTVTVSPDGSLCASGGKVRGQEREEGGVGGARRARSRGTGCGRQRVRVRELHTGLSPDKFALSLPRTGHPGRPVPAKPERKKKWKAVCPVAGTPTGQIRTSPDRTSSARPFPDRSPMSEAGPSGAPPSRSVVAGSRSSSQSVARPRVKIVAGRAPKGMPRAKSVQPAAVNLPRPSPQGPISGRASQTPPLRRGRACTAGRSGPATSAARGTGTHCCTKYAVYGSKWCGGPGAVVT